MAERVVRDYRERVVRDYRSEYDNYQGKPEQKKRRAGRNKARRQMEGAGRVSKGDGKDVDHRDRDPGNNSGRNLRVQSKSANRSRNSVLGRRGSILGGK